MARYTGQDIAAIALRYGATPELARIMGAAAMSEGGGNSEAVGDGGHSIGAYQIHDIHGLTGDQRRDLDFATQWMLRNEFDLAYRDGQQRGYADEELARWTCMAAERPYGWNGPNSPGLYSPAADGYAAWWHAIEEPAMPTTRTYDPSTPRIVQSDDWSCSVASLCWCLRSIGIDMDYPQLERLELGAGIVSTVDGLLVASGGPLAGWVAATWGLPTGHDPDVSWEWLQEHAGTMPIMLGGRHWGQFGHWVGVRGVDGDGNLTLSNPADGYANIFETLNEAQFDRVGPCSAVWLEVAAEENPEVIAELQQQIADAQSLLGTIQHEWADAVAQAINDAKREPNKAKRNADLDAALNALQTIRNGG